MRSIYTIDDNPQQRIWCGILYPDNEDHNLAINLIIGFNESILMLHDKDVSKKGEPIKPHYHFIMIYDRPYYKKKLVVNDLGLNWDENWHYIKSLKEIDYKRVDDYIIYLTHVEHPEKYQYNYDQFIGGYKQYAVNVCTNNNLSDDITLIDILEYLEQLSFTDHEFRYRSLKYIYVLLYKKYGTIIYRKWNFIIKFVMDFKGV